MSTEDEIKEYFDEDEWNNMSNEQKAMFTDFTATVQIFSPMQHEIVATESGTSSFMENEDVSAEVDESNDYISNIRQEPQEISNTDQKNSLEMKSDLYCDTCKQIYITFCTECQMLLCILDNDIRIGICEDRLARTLPKDILEIKQSLKGTDGSLGVFALKTIPRGVKFGPFEEMEVVQSTEGYAWKLENRNFISVCEENFLSWMTLVKCTEHILEQNLIIFQHENSLYFRTNAQINKGEELLIRFDERCITFVQEHMTEYYFPVVEQESINTYACTYCCLGFRSLKYLVDHKTVCPYTTSDSETLGEIVQCPFCKIYLDEWEYAGFHMSCCCEKHSRKCLLPVECVEINTKSSLAYKECQNAKPAIDLTLNENVLYNNMPPTYSGTSAETRSDVRNISTYICSRNISLNTSAIEENVKTNVKDSLVYDSNQVEDNFNDSSVTTSKVLHNLTDNPPKNETAEEERENSLKLVERSENTKLECSRCPEKFFERNSLVTHEELHFATLNEKTALYSCDICDRQFERIEDQKRHFHIKKERNRYNCQNCDYITNKKICIETHVTNNHTMSDSVTQNIVSKIENYSRRKHYIAFFVCPACNKAFLEDEQLQEHLLVHKKNQIFVCDFCSYENEDMNKFRRHDTKLHSINEKKKYRDDIKVLILKHSEELYECKRCNRQYQQKATLKAHILYCHMSYWHISLETKPYKCSRCQYSSKFKRNLLQHLYTHEKGLPYQCKICFRNFMCKDHFDEHELEHAAKDFLYKCTDCGYESNYMFVMGKHRRIIHCETK